MAELRTAYLEIEGMHCAGCVNRLTAALKRIPGVEVTAVQVGSAEIRSKEPVPQPVLSDVIRKAGLTLKTVSS